MTFPRIQHHELDEQEDALVLQEVARQHHADTAFLEHFAGALQAGFSVDACRAGGIQAAALLWTGSLSRFSLLGSAEVAAAAPTLSSAVWWPARMVSRLVWFSGPKACPSALNLTSMYRIQPVR